MARLTILLALLAALLLVAHASARLHQQEISCDSIMENVDLGPCEKYVMERIQQDEEEEDEGDVPSMKKRNGHRHMRSLFNRLPDYKSKCCKELSQLKQLFFGRTTCMCRAQNEIMQSQMEKLDSWSEVEQLRAEIQSLPLVCGIPLIERIGCFIGDWRNENKNVI